MIVAIKKMIVVIKKMIVAIKKDDSYNLKKW